MRGLWAFALLATPMHAQEFAAAGGHIAAVSNYDEPVSQKMPFALVARLYTLVKEVGPSLDVLMVHAPISNDNKVVPPGTIAKWPILSGLISIPTQRR